MSNLTDYQLKAILKSTEELVTKARLNQIAKEHQSIGSILDDRCLYAIEEPKKRDRSHSKQEIEKRLHSRRGGRGEFDIKAQADKALESFKDKGVNVEMLIGNYTLEQQIWKEKSSQAAYSQKRKYQFPELQTFRDAMPPIQRNLFKEKISEAIINLADKYREECRALQAEMDLNGVFHPEANAHRVHCIYLMKLHKGITSDAIEDPILRRFMAEKAEIARGKREEEERKDRLLQMIESSGGAALRKQDLLNLEKEMSATAAMATANEVTAAADGSHVKVEITTGAPSRRQRHGHASATTTELARSSSLKQVKKLAPINQKDTRVKLAALSGRSHSAASLKDPRQRTTDQSSLRDSEDEEPSVRTGDANGADRAGPGPKSPADKLFKKMKRDRLGAADARMVLLDEASRLDKGEVAPSKKTKDKNTLLEAELSGWMLSSLQKTQIAKTAGGSSLLAAGGLSTQSHTPLKLTTVSPAVMDFAKSLASSQELAGSPQRMLPFQEFYSLFQSHSQQQRGAQAGAVLATDAVVTAGDTSPPKAEEGRRRVPSVESQTAAHKATTAEETTQARGPVEVVNIVRQLQEQDPHFDAYLHQVADRSSDNPATQRAAKMNAQLTKPRRLRKVAPLGKDALQLKDSRGRVSKESLKGFSNHFRVHEAEAGVGGGDSHTEGAEEEDDEGKLRSNDLLGRLKSLHDDSTSRRLEQLSVSEEEASPAPTSPGTSTAPTPRAKLSRGRSRLRMSQTLGKAKQSLLAADADEEANPEDSAVFEMQDKLVAVWDCLQITTHTRINFMRKYSSEAYSVEMARAVDLWAETAVHVVALTEVAKCLKKAKSGVFLMPFELSALQGAVRKKTPLILSSASQSLVPPTLSEALQQNQQRQDWSPTSLPLSAVAVRVGRRLLESSFQDQSPDDSQCVATSDVAVATAILETAFEGLCAQVAASFRKVLAELEDVVYVGARPCREWLQTLQLQHQHTKAA